MLKRIEALERENRGLRNFIEELSKAVGHRYRETSARKTLGKEYRDPEQQPQAKAIRVEDLEDIRGGGAEGISKMRSRPWV